jgi:hypothetical protein
VAGLDGRLPQRAQPRRGEGKEVVLSEDVEALTAAFIEALREEIALIEKTATKEGP